MYFSISVNLIFNNAALLLTSPPRRIIEVIREQTKMNRNCFNIFKRVITKTNEAVYNSIVLPVKEGGYKNVISFIKKILNCNQYKLLLESQ